MSQPLLVTALPTAPWAAQRRGGRLALVPTLGALHAGHQSLMRQARAQADRVVVSIFVNPLQFGPSEDLANYPRDLAADLARCAEAGVDEVFHPDAAAFYPPDFQTAIEVGPLGAVLCGARRPGHFRGVATVVYRLFQLIQPDLALFGEKDYQQLQIVARLVRDLGLPVEVQGCPIVRAADGLALSSRNAYLSPAERQQALAIWRGLSAARAAFAAGQRRGEALRQLVREALAQAGLREDYVELCDPQTLQPLAEARDDARLLVAAFAGETRLIDNLRLG